jgi:hypothetical protein
MMAFMFHRDVDALDVERYMRALIRAQADIGTEPERYRRGAPVARLSGGCCQNVYLVIPCRVSGWT